MRNILNVIYKNPEKIKIEKEELRNEVNKSFYFIYLYFYLSFQKEKLYEIIDNEQVFEILIKYQKNFENIILPNEIANKLIEKAKTFNQVLIILFYLGKDCLNVLEIINEKKDKIAQLIIDENNEDNTIKIIEFEKYVVTKEEDNIYKMLELICKINIYEATEMKLVKFSPEIIKQYIQYNILILDNLRYINQIVLSIKKVDLKFKVNENLDLMIHNTGLKLIINKKYNNSQILHFINTDYYYQNKTYYKSLIFKPLEIFDGIDISSLDNEFFQKWKTINFKEIFEFQFNDYIKKIASLNLNR